METLQREGGKVKKKDKKKSGPECPICESKNILTKRSGESWCRRCGWSEKIINIRKGGGKE